MNATDTRRGLRGCRDAEWCGMLPAEHDEIPQPWHDRLVTEVRTCDGLLGVSIRGESEGEGRLELEVGPGGAGWHLQPGEARSLAAALVRGADLAECLP